MSDCFNCPRVFSANFLSMKKTALSLFLLVCCAGAFCKQGQNPDSKKTRPPQGMCEAASAKLREAGTDKVVLTMVVDRSGKVQSFTTDSPKGLRLEKMKEPATAINAMHFEPAKKDGRSVMVKIRIKFDCSGAMTNPIQPGR
jgi:hypothetical protein